MSRNTDFQLSKRDFQILCENGGKAPSGGNVQPWRVKIVDRKTMEFAVDEARSTSFIDVGRLASFLALGAFFENVRITAESLGYRYSVEKLKFNMVKDSLFQLTFTGRVFNAQPHPLYNQIDKRITNRKIHNTERIPEPVLNGIKKLVKNSNSNFILQTVHLEKEKEKIADILGKADGIRTLHDQLFSQMMNEIRWSHEEVVSTKDGIDIETLELPPLVKKMLNLMKNHPSIRWIAPRRVFENQAKPLLVNSSHLCCLSMKTEATPESMLEAGQLIQRIWLTATKEQLGLHPWTVLPFFIIRCNGFDGEGFDNDEMLRIKDLERQLHSAFDIPIEVHPIFVFRLLKVGVPSARSLRIPWEEYTEFYDL